MTGRVQRPRYRCDGCGRVAAWSPGKVCSRCVVDAIRERARGGDRAPSMDEMFPGYSASRDKWLAHLARERVERRSRVAGGGGEA